MKEFDFQVNFYQLSFKLTQNFLNKIKKIRFSLDHIKMLEFFQNLYYTQSVSCDHSAALPPAPTGPNRSEHLWTSASLGPAGFGPYRHSNGRCRCWTYGIDRHILLEYRYGPTPTEHRLVLVQGCSRCPRIRLVRLFKYLNFIDQKVFLH